MSLESGGASALKYRADIDGLRAIAVGSVILFHAGLGLAPGGYLGVDIFFVISGYLITSIIYSDVAKGSFSLPRFYERRIRRIIPASVLVMALTSVFAYFLMLPDDLENFGQSIAATTLFSNNVLLLLTSGYFGMAAEFKPLMHTWSLGVEEQYYFVVPFLLMATFYFGRRRLVLATLILLSILSLAFSVWAAEAIPIANFLLITSRAWELGLGGIVALLQPAWSLSRHSAAARALTLLGILMITLPIFVFDQEMALPSWPTLAPVVGVCLVLACSSAALMPGKLLALRPMVGLGLISYSAYLFHQPVFALMRVASLEEPSRLVMAALIPVILFMAWASWRWVEMPFRDRKAMSFPLVATILGSASALVLAVGLFFYWTAGLYETWPEFAEGDQQYGARVNAQHNTSPNRYLRRSFSETGESVRILVIGNSFARDFINMALATGHTSRYEYSYSDRVSCEARPVEPWLQRNITRAHFIVLGSGVDAESLPCVRRQIRQIRGLTQAPITIIGIKSFGWNNNAVMRLPEETRYGYRTLPLEFAREGNAVGRRAFDEAIYVDVLGMISDREGRIPVFTPDRKFISQDREHLTPAGARYIGRIIFQHPALRAMTEAGGTEPSTRPGISRVGLVNDPDPRYRLGARERPIAVAAAR